MKRVLDTVLSMLRATAGLRSRDELMQALAAAVRRAVPADVFAVAVFRGDDTELYSDQHIVRPSSKREDYKYANDPIALQNTQVVTIDELGDFPKQRALFDQLGMRVTCRMPMIVEDRVVGTLVVMARDVHAYDTLDFELAGAMGTAAAVVVDNWLAFEQVQRLRELAEDEHTFLEAQLAQSYADMVGGGSAFAQVRNQIEVVAPTDATVLITGESGTGKDVVARAIHASSPRASRAMVTINCAALPSQLAESELFGHVEGAFTGAVAGRVGRFEAADGSTLFLDEIGELSLDVQAKLLRVLQQRELERVGSGETIALDVRVIAATNRDLTAAVADETFRADLYYRLSVFPIRVPPLRDRRDDIPGLVDHFIERSASRLRVARRRVPAEAMRRLVSYDWPGNVRELQNAIERAMILSHGDELDVSSVVPTAVRAPTVVRDDERGEYTAALEACAWVIEGPTGAAARLGLHPNTLRSRLKRLGISRPR